MQRTIRSAALSLALFATLAITGSAFANVVWKGDFETGNTSQWAKEEIRSPDRLQIVDTPVREGRYAMRHLVKQGDSVVGSGNRSELLSMTMEPVGSEYYYRWSTFFPSTFPSADTWQVFTQWHHDGCCGSPPVEFFVVSDTLYLRTGGSSGKVHWSAPLKKGQWQDFIFHVKWSADPKVGFVELWHNGALALPKTPAQTMFAGSLNYLKTGLYRDASISQDGVLFQDAMVQATQLSDVLPPAPPPAPTASTTPPTTGQVEVASGKVPAPAPTPAEPDIVSSTSPGLASNPIPGTDAKGAGCTAGGSGLAAFAALGLAGLALRRRRVPVQLRTRSRR